MDYRDLPLQRIRRIWKWMNAPFRANRIQLEDILRQEKAAQRYSADDIRKILNLPDNTLLDLKPSTRESAKRMRAMNFLEPGKPFVITNEPLYKPMFFGRRDGIPLTDALRHEAGHIRDFSAHDNDSAFKKIFRKVDNPLKAPWLMFNPDASNNVKMENIADMNAFGKDGKLSHIAQLRHHPGIAGYRGFTRAQAALTTAEMLGGGLYIKHKLSNKNKKKK